jgi:uncharacterized protein YjiS (DUF1127 family)
MMRCNIVTGNQVNEPHLLTNKSKGGLLERMWVMSDFVHNDSTLVGRGTARPIGFAPAANTFWRWLAAPFRAFFARELVLRELTSLGDRDLADIGLSRSDIPAVVAGVRGRDGLSQRKLDPSA